MSDIPDLVARALGIALARERTEAVLSPREQRLQDQIDELRRALHAQSHRDSVLS